MTSCCSWRPTSHAFVCPISQTVLTHSLSISLCLVAEYVVMCVFKAMMKGRVAPLSTAKLKIDDFYNLYDMQHLNWIQVSLVYYLILLVYYLILLVYYLILLVYYLILLVYYLILLVYYLILLVYYMILLVYYLILLVYYLILLVYYLILLV